MAAATHSVDFHESLTGPVGNATRKLDYLCTCGATEEITIVDDATRDTEFEALKDRARAHVKGAK